MCTAGLLNAITFVLKRVCEWVCQPVVVHVGRCVRENKLSNSKSVAVNDIAAWASASIRAVRECVCSCEVLV